MGLFLFCQLHSRGQGKRPNHAGHNSGRFQCETQIETNVRWTHREGGFKQKATFARLFLWFWNDSSCRHNCLGSRKWRFRCKSVVYDHFTSDMMTSWLSWTFKRTSGFERCPPFLDTLLEFFKMAEDLQLLGWEFIVEDWGQPSAAPWNCGTLRSKNSCQHRCGEACLVSTEIVGWNCSSCFIQPDCCCNLQPF